MITIDEALDRICAATGPLGTEQIDLAEAAGRRLAAAIRADVDSPPHDKSLMDGYAARATDLASLPARLEVIETITAGTVPIKLVSPGTAARIMTGAPLPSGSDCIVMNEATRPFANAGQELVEVQSGRYQAGTHVMRRGQSMRSGDDVFAIGHVVRSHDVGLLAEVGCTLLTVYRRPRIAIVSTGDELVDPSIVPSPSKIRNSNGSMLEAVCRRVAGSVTNLGIAADRLDELRNRIAAARDADLLILSGGVSEGVADLVPKALALEGFHEVFHKVAIKPGKPLWFGISESEARRRFAFGLPGNPVSSLVCFEIFVRVAIDHLAGSKQTTRCHVSARLEQSHKVRGPRPTYWPVRLIVKDTPERWVEPLKWQGSSDLRCLGDADGLALFLPRETEYPAGQIVPTVFF